MQELLQADEILQARLTDARQRQTDQRKERESTRQLQDETNRLVSELRAQHSGLTSRIEVLQRLEESHEGLGAGVREVLALLESPTTDAGPWGSVVGMIADLLTVRHEYAPLIDLALGERAQRFLVRDAAVLAEALRERGQPFSGRVSFLPIKPAAPDDPSLPPNRLPEVSILAQMPIPASSAGNPAHPGVVALAEQLVTCENPELAGLPAQLLGRTLIVRDLDTAWAIAAHTSGFRFVTLQGELLESDGTLTVGTHHAETGILSRKSELRELREQVVALNQRIGEMEHDLSNLRDSLAVLDTQAERMREEIDVLTEQAGDLHSRVNQHRQRREGLHQEVVIARTEISTLEQEIHRLEETWQQAQEQAQAAEKQVQELQARLQQTELELHQHEEQRQQRQAECTTAKVALAQVDERLTALRAKYRQLESDWRQRQQEQAQGEQYLAATLTRLAESQQTMLKASAILATGYLEKESAERRLVEQAAERDRLRQERHVLAQRARRHAMSGVPNRSKPTPASWRSTTCATAGIRRLKDCARTIRLICRSSMGRGQKSEVRSQRSEVRNQRSMMKQGTRRKRVLLTPVLRSLTSVL